MISESIDELSRVEFDACLHDTPKTLKNFLKRIPYYNDKNTWYNIYLSCLLTFLNAIVLDKKTLERIQALKYKEVIDSSQKIWKYNIENNIILYHLDDNMKDYIRVLVKEFQHVMSNDLSSYFKTYIPSNNSMQYVALSELNNNSITDWTENEN